MPNADPKPLEALKNIVEAIAKQMAVQVQMDRSTASMADTGKRIEAVNAKMAVVGKALNKELAKSSPDAAAIRKHASELDNLRDQAVQLQVQYQQQVAQMQQFMSAMTAITKSHNDTAKSIISNLR